MKIQALMIAVALAAGSAFAAAPNGSAKADAATAAADTTAAPATPVKKSHKKTAKKKHAATQSMGAGPASPMTDLSGSSRQARIDQAYAQWQAKAR